MRRELLICAAILIAATAFRAPAQSQVRPAPAPQPAVGMNLNGPADWNTELPFVDVFRLSRRWISQREGAGWGQGPELQLDEHGWVTRLEPGCFAETPLCTIQGGHYPSGEYTVLYEGTGRVGFSNPTRVLSQQPGRIIIEVDSSRGGFFLRLLETDPRDYVRDIRVIMPGFESTYEDEPFHPVFLERWHGMACFRFMDWMHTNNSKISKWSERPTLHDATFTTKGVPLELMIDLCNRQDADAWFCMPHLADDDYVRRFAEMVHARLEPERKVYVEWSNETWNGQFEQSRYAGERGQARGFGEKPWEAGWRYTAYRSMQIFSIWEEVFGGAERLVRVLPTQAANPYVSERIVEFQDAWAQADALAIAPYISFNVPARGEGLTADVVAQWTVEQVIEHLGEQALPRSIEWIRGQKQVADKYGLKLIAYEGGQHAVGTRGGENNETLTALLQAANAHPGMGDIYDRYFRAWEREGGGLFAYFSSVGSWSKWGSWGIMQYYDEDPAQSPKFVALMRWARSLGQDVTVPGQ